MKRKETARPGFRTIHALVDIPVPENDSSVCGLYCPYQTDISNTTISCTLSGKKIRLKWRKDDELLRSTYCKKHEYAVRAKPYGIFVKSFLD
jgi:hypothetical protein